MNAVVATRQDLVRVVRAAGIEDARILAAFERIPRETFVPAASRNLAYYDLPVPIAHEQPRSRR